MNCLKSALILLSVIAISHIANGAESSDAAPSIQCYQCNSITEPGCKDPFNAKDEYLKSCVEGEQFCRKIVQTVDGVSSIIRQCAKELYKEGYEGCYKTAGKSSQQVCTCRARDGKACNSGVQFKSTLVALLLSGLLAFLLK